MNILTLVLTQKKISRERLLEKSGPISKYFNSQKKKAE